jgi:hypothetical protein
MAMDPATIASAAVGLLVPYAKKAMEEFAGEAGKTAFNKVAALFKVLKQRLTGDAAAEDTISRFEREPERYQPFLEDVLRDKLAQEKPFATELAGLVAEIEAAAPELAIVQTIKKVGSVVGLEASEVGKGRIGISQDIDEAQSVVGARIDRIGKP